MNKVRDFKIIDGPFSGTYGAVLIGRHELLGLKRAIKRLHDHIHKELIKDEALKQQAINSPYVVQIIDFFVEENAILMEYCPIGLDRYLSDRFKHTHAGLPFDEARDLLHGILQGLNDAHAVDVVHGDIKPANVRFGASKNEGEIGLPKLADFGAARRLREEDVHVLKGSTNWMAPEVIGSEKASKASDYFSFGILAYLILTGRHPFFADDPSCLTSEEDNITNPTFRPTPLSSLRSDIPPKIAELVMDLLSRDTDARTRAEQDLKAAFSRPLEQTEEVPLLLQPPRIHPTPEEAEQIMSAYEEARYYFFSLYRPREAVEILDDFLTEFEWERFKGQHVTSLADCWSLRAFINNSGGFFNDTVEAATNGLEVDPENVNSLHTRGYAYIQLGKNPEAKQDLENAFRLTSDPVKRRQINQLLDTLRARQS